MVDRDGLDAGECDLCRRVGGADQPWKPGLPRSVRDGEVDLALARDDERTFLTASVLLRPDRDPVEALVNVAETSGTLLVVGTIVGLIWFPKEYFFPALIGYVAYGLGKTALEFQPGSRWSYSALAGFETLGHVIEIATRGPGFAPGPR